MDAPLLMGEDGSLYDILLPDDSHTPDEKLLRESLQKEIERTFHFLNKREAEILRLFYGLNGYLPHSLDEIAEIFKLTRERVRQVKEKALKKMKSTSRNKLLRKYLG